MFLRGVWKNLPSSVLYGLYVLLAIDLKPTTGRNLHKHQFLGRDE